MNIIPRQSEAKRRQSEGKAKAKRGKAKAKRRQSEAKRRQSEAKQGKAKAKRGKAGGDLCFGGLGTDNGIELLVEIKGGHRLLLDCLMASKHTHTSRMRM